eukprot:RCo052828
MFASNLLRVAFLLLLTETVALTLNAGGSSLVSSLVREWSTAFSDAALISVNISFRPSSSPQGIVDVVNRKIDFALTSVPVTEDIYSGQLDLQLVPVVVVPLVFSYSLPGFNGTFTLTRPLLAAIFSGVIWRWDDPAIRAANPGASLPNVNITVLFRTGEAGTTQVLTSALATFSPEWDYRFGVFTDGVGFNGSTARLVGCASDQAIASMISSQPYTLGYLSLSTAVSQGLSFAQVVNRAGVATFPIPGHIMRNMLNNIFDARLVTSGIDISGLDAYPVLGVVYVLLRMRSMANPRAAYAISEFLRWILESTTADRLALDLGYIPVPAVVNSLAWPKLLDIRSAGKPVRSEVLVSAAGSVQSGTLMHALIASYAKTHTTVAMTYTPVSSSEAIREITYFESDFVLSDLALKDSDYAATANQPLQMVPLMVFGVALVVNLPELSSEVTLTFSREVLVGVFNGTVQWWDATELRRLNPFVHLPHRPIVLVTISQSSSITLLLQTALSRAWPPWATLYNVSSSPLWPPAVADRMLTADSHDAVLALCQGTPYSLAPVPYAIASQTGSTMLALRNRAGTSLLPSQDSIGSSAITANFTSRFTSDLVDTAGETSYSIVGFTSFVLRQDVLAADCRVADAIVNFVQWATGSAEALSVSRANGYVPAFSSASARVSAVLQQFTCNGELIIPPPVPYKLNLIPIVIPVVVGVLVIGAAVAYFFWKLQNRLKAMQGKLNDVRVAVELSDAIATFDLQKMAF